MNTEVEFVQKAIDRTCTKGVKRECGMLVLDNFHHYDEVYACLEQNYELWNDNFELQYGSLSDDDYNDMANDLNFVEEQPLIDFEALAGLVSYRRLMDDQEEAFLSGGGDPDNSPDADNIFDDVIMETMMNRDGAIMIGGEIYLALINGDRIKFCSCEAYQTYIAEPSTPDPNDPCVTVTKTLYYSGLTGCCSDHGFKNEPIHYDTDRKIRWKLRFQTNFSGNSRAISKINHYRKNNGIWWPFKVDLLTRANGISGDEQCEQVGSYVKVKAKKRKKLRVVNEFDVHATYNPDEAKGYWEFPNNNSVIKSLASTCP